MKTVILAAILLMILPLNVSAAQSGQATGITGSCQDYPTTSVPAVISAGNFIVCVIMDTEVSSDETVWLLGGRVSGPGSTSAVVYTWSIVALTGCTASSLTTVTTNSAASSSSNTRATITMTSHHCHGVLQLLVEGGVSATDLFTYQGFFNVESPEKEMLEVLEIIIPLMILVLLILWAEFTKSFILYLLAILLDIAIVSTLWVQISTVTLVVFVAIVAVLAVRMYFMSQQDENGVETI